MPERVCVHAHESVRGCMGWRTAAWPAARVARLCRRLSLCRGRYAFLPAQWEVADWAACHGLYVLQAMERFQVPFFAMNLSVGLSVQLQGFGLQVASGEQPGACQVLQLVWLAACTSAASSPAACARSWFCLLRMGNACLVLHLAGLLQGCLERCHTEAPAL